MDDLRVDIGEQQRSTLVVRISGSAGISAADDLERAVRLIKVRRPRHLVIDLAGLSFIASLGLGLLVSLSAAIKSDGGTIRFAGATPAIGEVIRRCKLDRVLPVYESVDEALKG